MQVNLSKLKRCHQYWEDMIPSGDGRICDKCQRVIIDFTGMSDREIALKHAESEKPLCGLYSAGQLDRSRDSQGHGSQKLCLALASVLGLGFVDGPGVATVNNPSPVVFVKNIKGQSEPEFRQIPESIAGRPISDSLLIRGRVLDSAANKPLAGANIFVKGKTNIGAATDSIGGFWIDLGTSFAKGDSLDLIISYIGFARREAHVLLSKQITDIEIKLSEDLLNVDVFYVVGKRPSFLGRVWNSIKSIF